MVWIFANSFSILYPKVRQRLTLILNILIYGEIAQRQEASYNASTSVKQLDDISCMVTIPANYDVACDNCNTQ